MTRKQLTKKKIKSTCKMKIIPEFDSVFNEKVSRAL